jgi:tudor domain-containing protein 1/4/6/7
LRGLPMEFAQQPGLAFKCCQDGAENFSDAASKFFGEIVFDLTHFSVKFLKVVNGVLCVRLSLDESDVSELCSSALAKSLTEEVAISFTNCLADQKVSRTLISVSEYTSLPVSEALVDVSVSWYYNPRRFFLCPNNLIQYNVMYLILLR